uniref:Uncharacterized protein n=1 Tax=Salix viminalis TaxID=40686 RepID=A0A6N2MC02_SALVM
MAAMEMAVMDEKEVAVMDMKLPFDSSQSSQFDLDSQTISVKELTVDDDESDHSRYSDGCHRKISGVLMILDEDLDLNWNSSICSMCYSSWFDLDTQTISVKELPDVTGFGHLTSFDPGNSLSLHYRRRRRCFC